MPAQGGFFNGKTFALGKSFIKGLYSTQNDGYIGDGLEISIATGTTKLPDIPATAGIYTLIAAGELSAGFDLTGLALNVVGGTAWSGGTAAATSISLQGTDGTVIATFQQQALTGNLSLAVGAGSTLPAGVVDNLVKLIGQTLAKGVGLVAVVSNSTAGSPVRFRISGRATP